MTYFFSSSGGHTESIQNEWPRSNPEPWLVGVPDPYDERRRQSVSPLGPRPDPAERRGEAGRAAQGQGTFVGIRVLKHGVSPRVITAAVVGTKGSTTVSGTELQHIFGLLTDYESFATPHHAGRPGQHARRRGAPRLRRARRTTQAVVALVPLVDSLLAGALPGLHGTIVPGACGRRAGGAGAGGPDLADGGP